MSKAAEFEGTCAVCFGHFKVRGERVVLHGYERPGDGYIHGSCYGEKGLAWEVSPESAQKFLEHMLRPEVTRTQALVRACEAGEVTALERTLKQTYQEFRDGKPARREKITPEHPDWAVVYKRHLIELEGHLKHFERLVVEFEKRVADWKPGTLKPVVPVAKHVRLEFNESLVLWQTFSLNSRREVSKARTQKQALWLAAGKGWTLPEGTELPPEVLTSDLYRKAALVPESETPAALRTTTRRMDSATAKLVLEAYELLTPGKRRAFDLLSLRFVQEDIAYVGATVALVTVPKLLARLQDRLELVSDV